MAKNVGKWDKNIRVAVGIILMTLAAGKIIPGWGYLGVFILFSGLFEFCPLYRLIKINTYKNNQGNDNNKNDN